jgi:uncharacterized protein (DUF302 family)
MSETSAGPIRLDLGFDAAVGRVRDALKAEGFGILTEVDMQSAFLEKLGKPFRPYLILGACNPPLAHRALSADPAVGLLLPCNVIVEEEAPDRVLVRLTDPRQLLTAGDLGAHREVRDVADDASARLRRVAASLSRAGA